MFKKNTVVLHLNRNPAPHAVRNIGEITREFRRRCCPYIMPFSFLGGTMESTQFAPRRAHYHTDLSYLFKEWNKEFIVLQVMLTVRLLTHVLCKPAHFFFHSFIATMSYPLQTSFISVMKGWADKYHVWGTPTRSPSRSNLR